MSPIILSVLIIVIIGINLIFLIFSFKLFSSFNTRVDALTQLFQGSLTQQFLQLTQNVSDNLASSRKELSESLSLLSVSLQDRVERLQSSNEARLEDIRKNVETKLVENMDRNVSVVKEMTEQLTNLRGTAQRIVEISQDINQLSTILQSPKLRGNIGEFQLENMLKQILPLKHFQMQAQVGEGRVDAAIYLKEGILCIDSKFPLENFRRMNEPNLREEEKKKYSRDFAQDVRKHVDSIAAKYIVPDTTLDFAFMFIPAESVYYEVLLNTELHEYALKKKVIPVSPNSLYAFLQTVAIGLRGMKIEQEARRIEQLLLSLKKDFDTFKDRFRLIGRHLDNAKSQFTTADADVQRLDNRLSSLSLQGDTSETLPSEDKNSE
ncbi:MAG: DNA recombination protein RmuC [Proteobacteria bacterium]|nr:DNA recombination protein RmuC [Pseudomonadota bacterium]